MLTIIARWIGKATNITGAVFPMAGHPSWGFFCWPWMLVGKGLSSWVIPSGNLLHDYGKIHPFSMGKSTINNHVQ